LTHRSPCDPRPLLAASMVSHADRSTLEPHTPVWSATRALDDSCDLLLPHGEITVTGIPQRDQSSRPTCLVRFSPSTDPVRSNLFHSSFAFELMVSTTETRCRQSARKPQWPDSLTAPLWGESLAGPSLRIKALD
jgi:hypothetical protein